jgi:GDP-4-dehydro-6-deoxy-D-mannose reductase
VRVLITGVSGFVGPYLADHIREVAPEAEVWGLVWSSDTAQAPPSVLPIEGDLTEASSMSSVVRHVRPDLILHLAAASSVAASWERPSQCLEINAMGTVNLLEAVRDLRHPLRVVIASSGEIYGAVPLANQPITEDAPLCPISPYAASKAAQDLITAQYFHGYGVDTVRLRLFHHTGPRRPPQFVASSFAQQIARIERGLSPPKLAVGNLEAVRDFTDVRDVARAYWLAAVQGVAGDAYNVCSGRRISIRRMLDILLAHSNAKIEVEVERGRLRAADIPCLIGDHTRISEATGWQPEIQLVQTLGDLLEWWRDNVETSKR